MQLTETQVGGFKLVSISEGLASAALELHQGYFTYYWRTRFDSNEFVELIQNMQGKQHIATTSLTVIDNEGTIEEVPSEEPLMNISRFLSTKGSQQLSAGPLSLVRFEGPGQSWVWQYAPDDGEQLVKYSNAPYRRGLAAYAGCASSGDHETTFAIANTLLSSSAVESRTLLPYLDLFARYLSQWRERKESWEAQ